MRGTKLPARGRLLILQALIAIASSCLVGRLWQLQMITGEKYRLLADRNRLREVDVAAPRGVIYDRNGVRSWRATGPASASSSCRATCPEDEEGDPSGAAAAAVWIAVGDPRPSRAGADRARADARHGDAADRPTPTATPHAEGEGERSPLRRWPSRSASRG